jgi:hypothetical protein
MHSTNRAGKSIVAEAFAIRLVYRARHQELMQAWVDEVATLAEETWRVLPVGELKPSKTITYGPQRKGKGGKVKRW